MPPTFLLTWGQVTTAQLPVTPRPQACCRGVTTAQGTVIHQEWLALHPEAPAKALAQVTHRGQQAAGSCNSLGTQRVQAQQCLGTREQLDGPRATPRARAARGAPQ